MSDPKHPPKIVIVVRGGMVNDIFTDKKIDARFFIADYDEIPYDDRMKDHIGRFRVLTESTAILDTASVRNIINKRGEEDGKEKKG